MVSWCCFSFFHDLCPQVASSSSPFLVSGNEDLPLVIKSTHFLVSDQITFQCFKQKKKGGKAVPAGKSAKTSPKRGSTPSVPNLATSSKTPVKTFTIDDVMDG